MKSLFEEMGGTYRQEGDYFIPNLVLPDDGDDQIGKYGRMRRCYLEEHRKILCTNYAVEGTLFKHLSEIDQACNERTEIIIPAMAKQEGVTEALKAADQMEWVCRMNSIHNRAEEIVLSELVYHLLRSTAVLHNPDLKKAFADRFVLLIDTGILAKIKLHFFSNWGLTLLRVYSFLVYGVRSLEILGIFQYNNDKYVVSEVPRNACQAEYNLYLQCVGQ